MMAVQPAVPPPSDALLAVPCHPTADRGSATNLSCTRGCELKKSCSALALLGFGAAVAGTAWFGSRYSPKDPRIRDWYSALNKPAFNPPDAVFPVVWSALYALMAISGWRVWRRDNSPERTRALAFWGAQLATNADWTRLFFGERRPKRALADVLLLEALIIRYITLARKVDAPAAGYFVPYAAWVAFATLLNAEIVRRNPAIQSLRQGSTCPIGVPTPVRPPSTNRSLATPTST